jgi:hypothetical protein
MHGALDNLSAASNGVSPCARCVSSIDAKSFIEPNTRRADRHLDPGGQLGNGRVGAANDVANGPDVLPST